MSDYYQSLEAPTNSRYLDNYNCWDWMKMAIRMHNEEKFVDMSLWPPVKYGHIFCYLIDCPGVYTKHQLLQWKSLEAYNYFLSGHVRTVKLWVLNSASSCILEATVNPSQCSPEDPHPAGVAVKSNGHIVTAHCRCMAG